MKKWTGKLGKKYTDTTLTTLKQLEEWYKKHLGITRSKMNSEFLGNTSRSIRILEVGCNIGLQLKYLQKIGFKSLYGIELQSHVVELAKLKTKNINIIRGSAFDIPFKNNFFDLVFTSGVLIHIAPSDIKEALKEIYRCTKRYIWGYEYFADSYTELEFLGHHKNLLWKTDFAKLYLDTFSDLRLVKEKRFNYLDNTGEYRNCVDTMFLLKKV